MASLVVKELRKDHKSQLSIHLMIFTGTMVVLSKGLSQRVGCHQYAQSQSPQVIACYANIMGDQKTGKWQMSKQKSMLGN